MSVDVITEGPTQHWITGINAPNVNSQLIANNDREGRILEIQVAPQVLLSSYNELIN